MPTQEMAPLFPFLALPTEIVRKPDARTTTANLIPVKAPLDGIVVARKIVAGEQVDASKVMFVIADTRQMWLTLNVRQEDARFVSRARSPARRAARRSVSAARLSPRRSPV